MKSSIELLETLVRSGALGAKRAADMKTSLRKLADAAKSPVDDLDLTTIPFTYPDLLRTYFAEQGSTASPSTQRNTLQNLKQYFGLLQTQGLLRLSPPLFKTLPRYRAMIADLRQTSAYRARYASVSHYALHPDQWPPSMQERWAQFRDERSLDVRPSTIQNYQDHLSRYVGYGLQVDQPRVTSWDDLFELARLSRFVSWHAKRVGAKRISHQGMKVFQTVTMLARYEQRPVYDILAAREKKLPIPEPMHNKQDSAHTISMQELEEVGLALLAKAEKPLVHRRPCRPSTIIGLQRAINCRDALLLRLMWRIPMRSRNFREMRLRQNLIQDGEGRWILEYKGDELKVSERRGRINTFRLPFPPELVDHLDTYLQTYRPLFPNAAPDGYVFIGVHGRMLSAGDLRNKFAVLVYTFTKKRFYPHLIRTLWVDQYLLATGDVSTAAYMLNDHVLTVMKRYHELRGADHTAKAFSFNQAILGNGKAHGTRTSR